MAAIPRRLSRAPSSVAPAGGRSFPLAILGVLGDQRVVLGAVALAGGVALRALFFARATWIWHFRDATPASALTPWARPAVSAPDGIEPYCLLALLGIHGVLTGLGTVGLRRAPSRWRALAVALLLLAVGWFVAAVPPRPPMAEVDGRTLAALLVVAGGLLAAWLVRRATRGRTSVPTSVAVTLVLICFVPVGLASVMDLPCVLAPSLALAHGISPGKVYLQYDLLPSLLGALWMKAGGVPLAFPIVTAASFYAALLGTWALARRLFEHAAAELAAVLLVSLVVVRFYGMSVDANALPQVSPLRLELWLPLVIAAFWFGLDNWRVGMVLGLLCLFSRSMGTLYVGAYVLALPMDFFARRRATPPVQRAPLTVDARRAGRRALPSVLLIAVSFVCVRLVFGSFVSDAVTVYRRLGVGMLPIQRTSFYWWLLPLTGAVGWLAFARRGLATEARAQARIFAVALVAINSMYFFGRSHEHNLINLGTSFLLLFLLGIDMASPMEGDDPLVLRAAFRIAPWAMLAACAYFYSGRVNQKLKTQWGVVGSHHALSYAVGGDHDVSIGCDEIAKAAGDGRVYLFSKYDFWFYEHCGYLPPGYLQPLSLAVLIDPLAAQMNQLLDAGYKIVVPKDPNDWSGHFPEFLTRLRGPNVFETASYRVYRRRP